MHSYSYAVNLGFRQISGRFVGDQSMAKWQRFWAMVAEVGLSLIGR